MNVIERAAFSETFVSLYQTTPRHVHYHYYLLLRFSDQNLVWISDLCHVCPRPYPLLLTNKANITFAFVGMFVPLVLLEGSPFGRRVGCKGTLCRRPGIAVDAARFRCLLSQNVWILRHAVGKVGPLQITQ
jgi:hypothetical protein